MTAALQPPELAPGRAAVPGRLLTAAAALSRHTACPDECVLGAAIAAEASRSDRADRLLVVVGQGSGQHDHVYDVSQPVSFRGLLAQRSASAAPAGRQLAMTVRSVAGTVLVGPVDPLEWEAEDLAMLESLPALIEDAVAHPDRPVSALCLVRPAERERILRDWNQTDRPYDLDVTVTALITGQVRRTPLSVALVDGTATMSYAALEEEANRLAGLLRRLGSGPGSVVGLYLERGLGAVISMQIGRAHV